jgi:hypothetical protein
MFRKLGLALFFVALGSIGAKAADFSGKWYAEFDTQIGVQKYTGTATNERGSTQITEGKIDGNNISFVEQINFNGNDLRIVYTGKIDGDQIKFTRQVGDFATEEIVANRIKPTP